MHFRPYCSALVAIIVANAAPIVANAAPDADIEARIEALKKENAAIRRENEILRENKLLRQQNTALKSATTPLPLPVSTARAQPVAASAQPVPLMQLPSHASPLDANAADLPLYSKTPIAQDKGVLRFWGEGGATLFGGDPVTQNYNLSNFGGFIGFLGGGGGGGLGIFPGQFDLTPKIGWEGATGFDYRFADSPWHVSAQFRYGESVKKSGTASTSGSLDATTLALLNGGGGGGFFGGTTVTALGGGETFSASNKETHWVADFAVGRDVFGSGATAMQVKGGIRIAELVDYQNSNDAQNLFISFNPAATIGGIPFNTFASNTVTAMATRNSFLGLGPRVGLEGSIPLTGKWAFDYLGDAALLFGTERSTSTTITTASFSPAFFNLIAGGGTVNTLTGSQFAGLLNGDIQVGVSYWVNQNLKVSASYRLDAFVHVFNESNQANNNLTPDRYIHGPRLAVSGQF